MVDQHFTLTRTNLYEQVADYLEQMILSDSNLKEEDKLPSEATLAEQFGVSRNVVRESLKILKERGLIDSRNGTGSYITKPEAENISSVINRMALMDEDIDFKCIYDVRIILETAACRLAAEQVTDKQLDKMAKLLERMKDKTISVEERRETDFAFHISIAEAAGNALLVILVRAMKNVFISMIEKGIFVTGGIDDASMRHAKILDALREHDADKTEKMMSEHLEFSKLNVEHFYENNLNH